MRHPVTYRSQFTQGRNENGSEEVLRQPQIWPRGTKARGERDAPSQERNAQVRQRAESEEPEAGNCDRIVRGAEKGSKSSKEEDGKEELRPEVESAVSSELDC
jgi:hypothetical protein